MDSVTYQVDFGGIVKVVTILKVMAAGHHYDVLINNYYHGRVWLTEAYGWQNDIKLDSVLTMDDIEGIIEIVIADLGGASDS